MLALQSESNDVSKNTWWKFIEMCLLTHCVVFLLTEKINERMHQWLFLLLSQTLSVLEAACTYLWMLKLLWLNMFLFLSLGQAFLTLSPLQISSLAVISGRLWVGTGGGALFSIPLSISKFYLAWEYNSSLYYSDLLILMFVCSLGGCFHSILLHCVSPALLPWT